MNWQTDDPFLTRIDQRFDRIEVHQTIQTLLMCVLLVASWVRLAQSIGAC